MVILGILLASLWCTVSAQGPVLIMTSGEACFSSRVDLLCTHPDPSDDPDNYLQLPITWAEDGTVIDFSDPANARFTPTRVNSTASTLSFNVTEEDHRDRVILCSCFLVRNNANRDRDESEALVLDPPEKASSPVVQSKPTNTSNVLRWTPGPGCYRQRNFTFNLTWTKMVDSPDSPSSGSTMTNDTQYDFSSLPRGEYSMSIQGWCNQKPSVESNMTSVMISLTAPVSSPGTTPTPRTDPPGDQTTIIIAVVVVVIVLIAIAILIIVGFVCVCSKQSKTSPTHETGAISPNPPKSDLYGRIIYAELEHSEHRPVAAPSQENVEYTQAVQVVHRRPPPVVPSLYKGSSEKDDKEFSRQDSNKSDEFSAQVVAIFQKFQIVRDPVTSGQNVLGNYKKTLFVANLVYVEDESQDVSDRDIERVAIAKSRHRTDKGLLVSNTGSIPCSLLEKLEKNGCHFIGLHTSDKEGVTEEMLMKKLDLCFT